MATRELSRPLNVPAVFESFFKPFNDFFDYNGGSVWNTGLMKVPPVNIKDLKDQYLIEMAVPGFKKEDFTIDLNKNFLTISVDKQNEWEKMEDDFTRSEYNYYAFTRSFTLPEGIKLDAIDARYENGILRLMLPKLEVSKKQMQNMHIKVH